VHIFALAYAQLEELHCFTVSISRVFDTYGKWVYKLLGDLEDTGLVSGGIKEETWNAVSKYWKYPKASGSEPRAVKAGRWR
jgi:hypothetical protein